MSETETPIWDEAFIERHNREVRASRRKYGPLIAAITREQAEEIVDLGHRQGLPMNQVAHRMQGRLNFEIPLDRDIAMGTDLFVRALEILDIHDADFRPRPDPQEMGVIGEARLTYHPVGSEFEVVLGERSERFKATYRPKFGVDVSDMARATEIAARLGETDAGAASR